MKGLYKATFRRMMAAVTAVTLVLGAGAYASETDTAKEETVYVFTDANGNEKKVLVNEWLKNMNQENTIDDSTTLSDVTNVKGDEEYEDLGNGNIRWSSNGNDIYYQGTTDKEVPVNVKITYTLDGKEISPKELAGKSGKV
ncbi:MAG: hypothetical protein PHE06_14285, partial [Lachnospiraceae bacterium]|nr:hypothetical protein [Lachnospiraceae bacterium]